jgi:competence protein ComER
MNTGFVGIGSMGGMLVRALLRSRALTVENAWAANRSEGKLTALAAEFPGIHAASGRKLAANCGLMFLCLKAGDTVSALAQMDPELHPGQLLVTTASQIPLQALEDRVPCRVAKLIPSITQEIGAGVTLLMYGPRATADDHKLLEDLMGPYQSSHRDRRVAVSASHRPDFRRSGVCGLPSEIDGGGSRT